MAVDERAGEQCGIARPFGERGDAHDDLGEAVIEVVAEAAVGDHRIDVAMRRADDARVDGDRFPSADAFDDTFLQEAQQLDLERQRHVADFVEEQGAAGGLFDLAGRRLHRAGERTLFVAEQFAFEQSFGDGGAVDRDEGTGAPRRGLMQPTRQQFLAGAAGAEQHDRDVSRRDAFDGAHHLRHRIRGVDQAAESCVTGIPRGEATVFRLEPVDVEGARDDQAQRVDVDRLGVKVPGPQRDGVQRARARAMAGGDDDLGIGLERQHLRQRRKAFAGAVRVGRQAEVERDDGGFVQAQRIDRLGPGGGGDDLIAFIGPTQLALQREVVLDDEQDGTHLAHAAASSAVAAGSVTRKRVPAPSRLVTVSVPPIALASSRAS